ncbi:MAG: hypothetical protein HXX14_13705 [Bacteroidetes bacterium]|nr:hypothetical protein [Bacteroidota bacterium]
MILKYKTGNLPPNFIYLGIMLFGISIWRMVVLDWKGLLIFVISLLCLFIKSGILIDTEKRRLKRYVGFCTIRKGEWENINALLHLQIIKTRETQVMSVLSISRTETDDVYKLIMVLPHKNIELLSGENDFIIKAANEISSELQTSVSNMTIN